MSIALSDIKRYKDSFDFEGALEKFELLSKEQQTPKALRLKAELFYQDKSKNTQERFQKALEILDSIQDDDNPDETNRLRGAIYKRRYHYSKDLNDIYRAISYYNKALASDEQIKKDSGYGAGNVIYLYYLLINERGDNISNEEKQELINKATNLATKSIKALKKDNLSAWDYASKATLNMALGEALEAKEAFEKYIKILGNTYDREYSITLTQFIRFYYLLPNSPKEDNSELLKILEPFETPTNNNVANVIESVKRGKTSLALSGGGFRASLFHIGILLSLAYQDRLRDIEVISTVSGGSIVGVAYYLMLKELLESKEDSKISKKDYIKLVETLKDGFIEAIGKNIRMMAFDKPLSTPLSEHLGYLYERVIYKRLLKSVPKSMADIAIRPKNMPNFNPHFHNELRAAKVPRIIINATLLNNGHNWQFSDKGMGEKSYMVHTDTDMNESYPFIKYKHICGDITIAEAVASSSAVPVIFDPIEIELYEGMCKWHRDKKETLRISDGGMYDNLGVASLVQDESDNIIISDGSKQLEAESEPSNFRLDMLNKNNAILMYKIRDAEYQRVQYLYNRGVIKELEFYHLRSYTDDEAFNELLDICSKIRTDLDAFSNTEANSLIYCGFRLSTVDFENSDKPKSIDDFHHYYQTKRYQIIDSLQNSKRVKPFGDIRCFKVEIMILSVVAIVAFIKYPIEILSLIGSVVILSSILYKINKKLLKSITNKIIASAMRYFSRYYLKYKSGCKHS